MTKTGFHYQRHIKKEILKTMCLRKRALLSEDRLSSKTVFSQHSDKQAGLQGSSRHTHRAGGRREPRGGDAASGLSRNTGRSSPATHALALTRSPHRSRSPLSSHLGASGSRWRQSSPPKSLSDTEHKMAGTKSLKK